MRSCDCPFENVHDLVNDLFDLFDITDSGLQDDRVQFLLNIPSLLFAGPPVGIVVQDDLHLMGFCFRITDAGFVEKPEDGEFFDRNIAFLLFEPGCVDLFDDGFELGKSLLRGFLAGLVELDNRIRFFTNREKVG